MVSSSRFTFLHSFLNLFSIQACNALLQILLFPIIIRSIGLEAFGMVSVANAYAGLLGLFINYGTNLSGIKDVALARADRQLLSEIFFDTIYTRILLFGCLSIVPLALYLAGYSQLPYLLFATPIIFAEVINPVFFFNGIEKLSLYNLVNLLARLISAALIVVFVNKNTNPAWVNFYLSIANVFFYAALVVYAVRKYHLSVLPASLPSILRIIRKNFFLVGNNLSVHLQQSFFLFLLSLTTTPMVLGAYSVCDKVIWSFRLLLMAFSNAIYPKAAISYQTDGKYWHKYKPKINLLLAFVFLAAAVVLFFANKLVVYFFMGSHDDLAALYVRTASIVPFFAAMNCLNIIELLIRNRYRFLFYNSLVLLVVTITASLAFALLNYSHSFAWYAVLMEVASLIISLYFIGKTNRKTPVTG